MKTTILATILLSTAALSGCATTPPPEICADKSQTNGTDPRSVRLHNACIGKPSGKPSFGKRLGIAVATGALRGVSRGMTRRTYRTTYKYDRYGRLKSSNSPYAWSRIHRNRDGSIKRIGTRLKY